MNKMQEIKIEKLTLNIGAGKDQGKLEKGLKLIKHLTGLNAIKCKTTKRIPTWGLRPGLPVGCKITIRNKVKIELIKSFLKAKANKLKLNNFDSNGSIAFGITEYIDIPDVKYSPEVGLMGLQISITLERPGFRIKRRRIQKKTLPKKHRISKENAIEFMKKEFNLELEE